MANTLPTTMEYFDNLLGEQLTGGGGGSSDFSTAEVTIVNSSNLSTNHLYFPFINPEYNDIEAHNTGFLGTRTFTVPLYMNRAAILFDEMPAGINVTGDAEIDEEVVVITGDCTITIS